MATKYRLKEELGGYLALTSATYERIIRGDEELDLSAEELERLKKYVEPIPKVKKVKLEKVIERGIDKIVEDDK